MSLKAKLIGPGRSREALRNIAISFVCKGICVLCSLLIVPLTINYVNPTQYGIWLTISSIIGWIVYFDLGIGNGFRNKYAEAKAVNNIPLCREYLSTAYISVAAVTAVVFLLCFILNGFLDWSSILNIDSSYSGELRKVFGILLVFASINLVANLFSMFLTAEQKPGLSSAVTAIGQVISLVSIFLLTRLTEGSLVNLAVYYAGIPCLTLIAATFICFSFTRYKVVRPGFRYFRFCLVKDILGLGVKFLVICLSMVLIFQLSNIVITRELGPDAVTEYNIASKYFNILYSVMIIVITPFWSAFTDAYVKKDGEWMVTTVRKLEKCFLASVGVALIMLLVSKAFYRIWVGEEVIVNFSTSLAVMAFVIFQVLANIYMYIINGIGTIRIQLITYLVFAAVAWPLLVLSCRYFGLFGVVMLPAGAYLAQAILGKVQLSKLLAGTAKGWWIK